jgi:H+-translocating NAD(P) transhydrogenase subunit alpha
MQSTDLLATAHAHTHALSPLTAAEIFPLLFILILAGFVGYEVIGRVSPTLHTPLMAATNAISGISLVGSLVAAGGPYSGTSHILGMIAVCAASINVVGGFMITDRMLRMFKKKSPPAAKGDRP